jgi:hypothetical protein
LRWCGGHRCCWTLFHNLKTPHHFDPFENTKSIYMILLQLKGWCNESACAVQALQCSGGDRRQNFVLRILTYTLCSSSSGGLRIPYQFQKYRSFKIADVHAYVILLVSTTVVVHCPISAPRSKQSQQMRRQWLVK